MEEDLKSNIVLNPIGKITTPYSTTDECPSQGRLKEAECIIDIFPEYIDALLDIDKCSHLIVLYWFHLSDRTRLQGKKRDHDRVHGVFATRSPHRPNPIAISSVPLLKREGNRLFVKHLECVTGTYCIDLKAYSPDIDSYPEAVIGWRKK